MQKEYTVTEAQLTRLKEILAIYNTTVISEWNEDYMRPEVEKILADIEFGSQTGFAPANEVQEAKES